MKRRSFTIIDVISIVDTLSRAGQKPGKTNVARLAGVTVPRAALMLTNAIFAGLLSAYGDNYRGNVVRSCYHVTDTGKLVLRAIADHDDTLLWSIDNDTRK